MGNRRIPLYLYAGIFLIVFMQACLIFQVDSITRWATPVLWTGLILAFDAILRGARGYSYLTTRAIFPVALISVISWWMFEWFNIFLSNWHYIHLTQPLSLRYLGYAWSFATIIPGVLLTYGIIRIIIKDIHWKPLKVTRGLLVTLFVMGFFFLAIPVIPFSMYFSGRAADPDLFFWLEWARNTHLAEYTAAFVWTGLVMVLEPLNYLLGGPSLLRSMQKGNYTSLVGLALAGLACGYLWEFWNFWAHTKWYYTVPIWGHIKLFEMPILGYGGFITFAWELYALVSLLYPKAILIVEGPEQ